MNYPIPFRAPDSYTPCHYTTSRRLLDDKTVNVTFFEVLRMTDEEFLAWVERLRACVKTQWDDDKVPPRAGLTDGELAAEFDAFMEADASKCWVALKDGATGLSTHATSGSFVTNWFPTMMKTRINYNENDTGRSIYDFFNEPTLFKRYLPYARRHFKRDSFYAYSRPIAIGDPHVTMPGVKYANALEYINLLLRNPYESQYADAWDKTDLPAWSFWFAANNPDEGYTGYAEHLKDRRYLSFTKDELLSLAVRSDLPPHIWANIDLKNLDEKKVYQPRVFRTDTRLFPQGFKSFRVSMCQYATNFPPMIARAIYEKYAVSATGEQPIVWDPSSGWAGRLTGALCARTKPLYIGCDPNGDHSWEENGEWHSKYTEIGAYYKSRQTLDRDSNLRMLYFKCGSEEMQHQPAFLEYMGRVDLVFTSPPYFNREAYSEDEEQSYKKFNSFEAWCEGFLKPTIYTAARWLRPGGHMLWNIADVKIGKNLLPLEERSIAYAKEAGLIQLDTLRLLLMPMPGANRVNEEGQGTAKNTCLHKDRVTKYEPIFVFQKPFISPA